MSLPIFSIYALFMYVCMVYNVDSQTLKKKNIKYEINIIPRFLHGYLNRG